jgi:four helix bundle protein
MDNQNSSILTRCYDLLKHTGDLIKNFPRDQKYILGDRIYNLVADLLEMYIEAFYSGDKARKKEMLQRANIQLEKMRFFIRIAYESGLFSSGKYRQTSELIDEIGRMTGAWIKKL